MGLMDPKLGRVGCRPGTGAGTGFGTEEMIPSGGAGGDKNMVEEQAFEQAR
jgi:hypothetical protein